MQGTIVMLMALSGLGCHHRAVPRSATRRLLRRLRRLLQHRRCYASCYSGCYASCYGAATGRATAACYSSCYGACYSSCYGGGCYGGGRKHCGLFGGLFGHKHRRRLLRRRLLRRRLLRRRLRLRRDPGVRLLRRLLAGGLRLVHAGRPGLRDGPDAGPSGQGCPTASRRTTATPIPGSPAVLSTNRMTAIPTAPAPAADAAPAGPGPGRRRPRPPGPRPPPTPPVPAPAARGPGPGARSPAPVPAAPAPAPRPDGRRDRSESARLPGFRGAGRRRFERDAVAGGRRSVSTALCLIIRPTGRTPPAVPAGLHRTARTPARCSTRPPPTRTGQDDPRRRRPMTATRLRRGSLRLLGESVCRQLGIYRVPDDLVLSVVIPVYNERNTIHEILRQVRAVPIHKQIILVDDCSKDGTREILQRDGRRPSPT